MQRIVREQALVASLLVFALLTMPALGQSASGQKGKEDKKEVKKAKKPKGNFTIGKDTTVVDGPFDEDGYIDYAAALNQRLGQGVTPATNANVLLWQAFGPHPEGSTMPAEFFKLLGIEAPPKEGEYFVDHVTFMAKRSKADPAKKAEKLDEDLLYRLAEKPWTAKEHPDIAAWLKANEKPLALVVEASRRPKYFNPLVPPKTDKRSDGLISGLIPGVQSCRQFSSALTARAMLRAGEGDLDGAWEDLLACHRLGRLIGHGGTLIEPLVGIAMDAIASTADLAFLEYAKPNAKRIESSLRDLRKLPPHQKMGEVVNLGERFMFLDVLTMIDRHGVQYLEGLSGGGKAARWFDTLANLFLQGTDWDPVMRNANPWYDRLVAAMRENERDQREKGLEKIDQELRALKVKVSEPGTLAQIVIGGKEARGKVLSDLLISLLVPALRKVQHAEDRTTQIQHNLSLAFALAWYQRDHGRFPEKLDALASKYLKQIPRDLFSGKTLVYRPAAQGYLLYSIGVNGQDEGGRSYDDNPSGDDLVVRMPLPPRRPTDR